ncbi:hypothetical protein DIPPA_26654 [Diplonema papillatum]|nr:hypothetical protein DIPPA_26654 [Diplonema papillatum]
MSPNLPTGGGPGFNSVGGAVWGADGGQARSMPPRAFHSPVPAMQYPQSVPNRHTQTPPSVKHDSQPLLNQPSGHHSHVSHPMHSEIAPPPVQRGSAAGALDYSSPLDSRENRRNQQLQMTERIAELEGNMSHLLTRAKMKSQPPRPPVSRLSVAEGPRVQQALSAPIAGGVGAPIGVEGFASAGPVSPSGVPSMPFPQEPPYSVVQPSGPTVSHAHGHTPMASMPVPLQTPSSHDLPPRSPVSRTYAPFSGGPPVSPISAHAPPAGFPPDRHEPSATATPCHRPESTTLSAPVSPFEEGVPTPRYPPSQAGILLLTQEPPAVPVSGEPARAMTQLEKMQRHFNATPNSTASGNPQSPPRLRGGPAAGYYASPRRSVRWRPNPVDGFDQSFPGPTGFPPASDAHAHAHAHANAHVDCEEKRKVLQQQLMEHDDLLRRLRESNVPRAADANVDTSSRYFASDPSVGAKMSSYANAELQPISVPIGGASPNGAPVNTPVQRGMPQTYLDMMRRPPTSHVDHRAAVDEDSESFEEAEFLTAGGHQPSATGNGEAASPPGGASSPLPTLRAAVAQLTARASQHPAAAPVPGGPNGNVPASSALSSVALLAATRLNQGPAPASSARLTAPHNWINPSTFLNGAVQKSRLFQSQGDAASRRTPSPPTSLSPPYPDPEPSSRFDNHYNAQPKFN